MSATTPERRLLGPADCTLLVIGNMIGTGVFLTTGFVAQSVGRPGLVLAAWALGAVFALAGALTFAEMGALFPRAGGHYIYLREAYGPLAGFLDGWVTMIASFPCGIAFMAAGFSSFLAPLWPGLQPDHVVFAWQLPGLSVSLRNGQLPGLAAVVALTVVNCVGLRAGRGTQNALTALKVLALLAIIAAGFLAPAAAASAPVAAAPAAGGAWGALAGALIGVSFAYFGWDAATYVAGEVAQPQRTLPRALAVGAAAVAVVYLLFNAALLRVVPFDELRGAEQPARLAAARLLGDAGPGLLSAVVALCILGAMNATILTGGRVTYALARDRLFFPAFARTGPRGGAPVAALVLQGLWTCLLVLTGTFGGLLTATVFAMATISVAAAGAVFVLRRRCADLPRPFRVPLYPWLPLLYVLGTGGILANSLIEHPRQALYSLGAAALGLPLYLAFRARGGGAAPAEGEGA